MRLVLFLQVIGWSHCVGIHRCTRLVPVLRICLGARSMKFSQCLPWYEIGAFCPVLDWHHFHVVRPSIRSLRLDSATSMYPAYCMWDSNPKLLEPSLGMWLLLLAFALLTRQLFFISSFSQVFPILAREGLCHNSIPSCSNQNPGLGSICVQTVEWQSSVPFINTLPYHLHHWNATCVIEWFWFNEHRKRVSRYDTTQLQGSM